MNTIAIDCGASFIKGALFKDGTIGRIIHKKTPASNNTDVFNIEKITVLEKIVREIITELSEGIDEANLCISNEMHGFILADKSGNPYTGYISWQTELISKNDVSTYLKNKMGEESTRKSILQSGMPLRSGLPVSNLLWLEINGKLDFESLHFYTLGDYLIRKISGNEPYCHPTNAAATGLYDLEISQWNKEYIEAICGDRIIFPKIGYEEIVYIMSDVTLHIKPAIGDQQAALLGSGFMNKDELSFNMGTGAQVSRIVDDIIFGDYQIRPYFGGKYIKTVPHIPSGRALNVFFRFFKSVFEQLNPEITDDEVWNLIRTVNFDDILKNQGDLLQCELSFFENAVTKKTVGSIENVTESNFVFDNLVCSVFRNMADNFISIAKRINDETEGKVGKIIFSGGMSKQWDVLRSLIFKGLSLEATVICSENDTLHGCCYYAEKI